MKKTFAILFFSLCVSFLTNIYAQDSNKLEKANELYKAKRYAEAIPIYEELQELDFNKTVLLKLARSHRQINNIEEALENYRFIMQQPEVKPDRHLEFVELLIMNGDYLEAKKSISDIPSTNGTITEIMRLTSMINNNYNLKPLHKNVSLENFQYNAPLTDENSPYLVNGKILFTSDQSKNTKLKIKSGLTGRAYYKVWESSKVDSLYTKPTMLSPLVNTPNKNIANAVFDQVHQEILFSKNDNTKDRNDFYNMQLYSSPIKKGKFGKAKKLSVNSTAYNYMHPCISKDGKTLLYVSDRAGEGGTDIFIARRKGEGWTRGKNIGNIINTPGNEGFPFLDHEGNLYFCSKGHYGLGGYDIFLAKKNNSGSWDAPVNLGAPFNSQHDDISIFIKENGKEGAFTSSRNGSDDIFLFLIESE